MDTHEIKTEKAPNPFKGVPGGDPSRHPKLVEVSYKCPSCGTMVVKNIREGKPIPSTPCQKCLDAVNAQRSKDHIEEVNRRIRAREAEIAARPTRTDEEYAALTAYLDTMPKMKCGSCAQTFPVGVQGSDYLSDDPYKDNSVHFVQFMKNPFRLEVHGEIDWQWMCNKCEYESHMDV